MSNVMKMKKAVVPQKDRIAYLDIAKAIGILLVVFAHINIKGLAYQTFYSFHIPLFFILAGMTFRSEGTFREFISKKTRRLILPYIAYSLITFAWYALVEVKMPEFTALTRNQTVFGAFMEIFLARGSVDFLQHNPALWFIPCLFITEMIYFGLCRLKKQYKIIAAVVLGVVGYIFTLDFMPQIFRELPWQAGVAFVAIPFMLFGEFITKKFTLDGLRKPVLTKKALSWVLVVCAFAAVVGLTLLNAYIIHTGEVAKAYAAVTDPMASVSLPEFAKAHTSMGTKQLGNIGIFYVNAILGSCACIALSILLEDLLKERIALHKSWLVWLGERSYAIMAIHYPVKRRMVVIVAQAINAWHLYPISGLYTTFTSNNILPSFIAFIFTMVITIIITIAAEAFMDNAQWMGKSRQK